MLKEELDRIDLFSNLGTLTKEDIFKLVSEERNRQDAKFGSTPRFLSFPFWQIVALEELGEINRAYLELDTDNFITETIQTIAVLVAMLEDITYNG